MLTIIIANIKEGQIVAELNPPNNVFFIYTF